MKEGNYEVWIEIEEETREEVEFRVEMNENSSIDEPRRRKSREMEPTKCFLLPIERIEGIEGNNQEEIIQLIENQRYSMKMKLVDDSDQPIPFNPNQQEEEQEEERRR